jgi:hypothetical protein
MWSGPTILEITDPAAGFNVDNGGSITIEFRVRDANFNPIVGGSQISVTTNNGTLGGQTDFTMPDTQDDSYTFFSVTLSDDDSAIDEERSVTVTINVTSPNGDRQEFLTGTIH